MVLLVVLTWLAGVDVPAPAVPSDSRLTPAVHLCGKLRVSGRSFECADGAPFHWRGVTGFRMVHQVASGDEEGARRYLEWARTTGFNLIRVLSTARLLFDLSPEDGRAALPRALELARESGLYVEVVAIADSAEREYDWRGHARAVAEACARHDHCLFEFANEPGHGTQDEQLHDMNAVQRFAEEAVAGLDVVWTAGPSWASDVDDQPAGSYVVRHLDRGGEAWPMAARIAEFEALSARLDKPVVSDEPIGFDEADGDETGRQRMANCDVALAFGVMGRITGVGSTFHSQAGLQNELPGPVQSRCAEDFIHGTQHMPDAVRLGLREPGAPGGPLANGDLPGAVAVHAGVAGNQGLVIALGLTRAGEPSWTGVRAAELVEDRNRVRVWRVELESGRSGGSLWESNPPLPPEAGGGRF